MLNQRVPLFGLPFVAADQDLSVSFLGGPAGVGERVVARLTPQFPRLRVAGVYAPPLGLETVSSEMSKAVEAANKGEPDLLFVALGTPKAENWGHLVRTQLQAGVAMGVSGALEILAGRVLRVPRWIQNAGVEWARRLWIELAR